MENSVNMILEFISDFGNISNLCSIAGFSITILTFIFTAKVKKAVNLTNKEILFKHLSERDIVELKARNSLFLNEIKNLNKQTLRLHLSSLKTKLDFFKSHSPRSIPTKKAIKQLKFLYKCDFLTKEEEKRTRNKYVCIRKLIHNANNDDLYEAYRRIIVVIDTTEQLRKLKNII